MSWQNVLNKNYVDVEDKISQAPQYVQTAWGEVRRWLESQGE